MLIRITTKIMPETRRENRRKEHFKYTQKNKMVIAKRISSMQAQSERESEREIVQLISDKVR